MINMDTMTEKSRLADGIAAQKAIFGANIGFPCTLNALGCINEVLPETK